MAAVLAPALLGGRACKEMRMVGRALTVRDCRNDSAAEAMGAGAGAQAGAEAATEAGRVRMPLVVANASAFLDFLVTGLCSVKAVTKAVAVAQ
jgi:hypothetical protein